MENLTIKATIQHNGTIYEPVCLDEISVEWTRFGSPGKMILTVLEENSLTFREGDVVRLKINGKNFFFGYIFIIDRAGQNQYKLTCYDGLRYLKSDDIFKMKKQTYTKALKTVLKRYGLKQGTIANTKYVRKAKVFNGCVWDMLDDYRKKTKESTGIQYILYADFNKICLQPQSKLKTNYIITESQLEDFSYTSSIDDKVYTVVKMYKGSGKKMKIYTKTGTSAKKKYGRLTYVKKTKLKSKAKIKKKLKAILEAHDSPRKKVTLNNVFGLTDIRAGSQVKVDVTEGGLHINRKMVVDTVTHHFRAGRHTMDLNVFGGDYKLG